MVVSYLHQSRLVIFVCLCVCVCRSDLQCSKSCVLNSAPVIARLLVQRNIVLVNTVKAVSSTPPPTSDDNRTQEKRLRVRQKTVKMKPGISEHDMNIKISHVCNWLQKGYPVSVFISKNINKPGVSFAKILSVNLLFITAFPFCFSVLLRKLLAVTFMRYVISVCLNSHFLKAIRFLIDVTVTNIFHVVVFSLHKSPKSPF